MKSTIFYKWSLGLLAMALCLNFSMSFFDEAMAKKAKFRYDKPESSQWINYCKKEHSGKTLKRCCARRNGSCQARCAKSKYPNTAYATKNQCISDCSQTKQECVSNKKENNTSKPKPKITSLSGRAVAKFKQCRSINNVVEHNVCCAEKAGMDCVLVCDEKVRHPKIRDKCYSECNKHQQGCYKKHTKKAYAKIQKKSPNKQWMKNYCGKRKNRKGKTMHECCVEMEYRCFAACEAYPDTKKAISQCVDRCLEAENICNGRK